MWSIDLAGVLFSSPVAVSRYGTAHPFNTLNQHMPYQHMLCQRTPSTSTAHLLNPPPPLNHPPPLGTMTPSHPPPPSPPPHLYRSGTMVIAATTAGDVHLLRVVTSSSTNTCYLKEEEENEEKGEEEKGENEKEEEKEKKESREEENGEEQHIGVGHMEVNNQMGISIDIETSFKLAGEIYSSPIVGFDQRSVYVGCRDDSCHCLVLEDTGIDLDT